MRVEGLGLNRLVLFREVDHEIEARLPRFRELLQASHLFRMPPFLKLTNTDPFAAWFAVTGNATTDGIRVVSSCKRFNA